MTSRMGLHSFTLKGTPADRILALAAEAGFSGVELRQDDLDEFTAAGGRLGALARQLRDLGLTLIRVSRVPGWLGNPGPDRQAHLDGIRRAIDAARELGSVSVGSPFARGAVDAARGPADLREVAAMAADAGLPLSMEILGFAPVWQDIGSAWALVREAGADNVQLLLDTFHLYRGRSRLEELADVPADRIAVVHVNDAPARPPEALEDTDRVQPGDGGLPLAAMLGAIHGHGYRGWYSLEVMGPSVWGRDPREVAREGAARLRKALEGIGPR